MNTKSKYPPGVIFIKKVYGFFAIITPFVFLLGYSVDKLNYENSIEGLVSYLVLVCVYYGIGSTKSWVVNLLLIYTTWRLTASLNMFFATHVGPVEETMTLLFKIIEMIFYVYSFIVFTRQSTRICFKEKGITII